MPTGRSGPGRSSVSRAGRGRAIRRRSGVGSVRKLGTWPLLAREETVAYEQDRRHAYKLVGPPIPAKDYSGEVVFTPNPAGGTDIRWTGSFVEGVRGTGPVMRAVLGGLVRSFAGRLVKAAERESGGR